MRRGRVRWHSKDRDEVYRQAVKLRSSLFAMLYTGRMAEDSEIVLSDLVDRAGARPSSSAVW